MVDTIQKQKILYSILNLTSKRGNNKYISERMCILVLSKKLFTTTQLSIKYTLVVFCMDLESSAFKYFQSI